MQSYVVIVLLLFSRDQILYWLLFKNNTEERSFHVQVRTWGRMLSEYKNQQPREASSLSASQVAQEHPNVSRANLKDLQCMFDMFPTYDDSMLLAPGQKVGYKLLWLSLAWTCTRFILFNFAA